MSSQASPSVPSHGEPKESRAECWKRRLRRLRSEISWSLARGVAYGIGTAVAGLAVLWVRQRYGA